MELSKVTMIIRGYTYEQVRCVAEVLINSSYVKNMEITLNTSNAYEIIKKIADEFQGRLHIGAGTVQTYDELVQAIAAGADVYVTGDIGHHEGIDALARGLNIIDAGHYGVEHIFIGDMGNYLRAHLLGVEVIEAPVSHPFTVI